MSIPAMIAVGFFVLIYAIGSSVELIQWRKSIGQFERWGYPRYWPFVTQGLKIAGGLMTLYAPTRTAGVVLCLTVALAGSLTLLRFRERALYAPSFGISLLTVAAAATILLS